MTTRKHRSRKHRSRKLGRKHGTRTRRLTAGYSYSKSRRSRSRKRVGGCGCGSKLHGGYTYGSTRSTRSRKQSGGNGCGAVGFGTSFENLPIHRFYPYNSYDTDPNYYSLASRNIPM